MSCADASCATVSLCSCSCNAFSLAASKCAGILNSSRFLPFYTKRQESICVSYESWMCQTYLSPILKTEQSARADLLVARPRVPWQVASFELLQPFLFLWGDLERGASSVFAFLLSLRSFTRWLYCLGCESRCIQAIGRSAA